MAESGKVRTPLREHFKRFRVELLPVVAFGIAVVAVVFLLRSGVAESGTLGEVNAVQVAVPSPTAGLLIPLSDRLREPALHTHVDAEGLIARLDDKPTLAALDTLQKELARLRVEISSTTEKEKVAQLDRDQKWTIESRRLAMESERLRVDILDRQAQIESDRIQVPRLEQQADALKQLVDNGAGSRLDFAKAIAQRDEAAHRLVANEKAVKEMAVQQKSAEEALGYLGQAVNSDLDKILAPLRAAIGTQESRITELRVQAESLEVRAPIGGTVVAITRHPGEAIRAGEPILTIASERGELVTTYIRESQKLTPRLGMTVEIRSRANPRLMRISRVRFIDPQIAPVPAHQLVNRNLPEWGTPVHVDVPDDMNLKPGELVTVRFRGSADGG